MTETNDVLVANGDVFRTVMEEFAIAWNAGNGNVLAQSNFVSAEDSAKTVIDLVRADTEKRIVEKMLSDGVVEAGAAAMFGRGHDPKTYIPYAVQPLEFREHYEHLTHLTITAALTAGGLVVPHE